MAKDSLKRNEIKVWPIRCKGYWEDTKQKYAMGHEPIELTNLAQIGKIKRCRSCQREYIKTQRKWRRRRDVY